MFYPDNDFQHDYSSADVLNDSLTHATADEDVGRVSNLLDSGLEINTRDPSFSTALHCAIRNNSSAVVHLLLSRKVIPAYATTGLSMNLMASLRSKVVRAWCERGKARTYHAWNRHYSV
jgi:ankyrin repeat protein